MSRGPHTPTYEVRYTKGSSMNKKLALALAPIIVFVLLALTIVSVKSDEGQSRPIAKAAQECGLALYVEDEGRSIYLDMKGEELFSGSLSYSDLECMFDNLEMPRHIVNRMGSTRALDGTQQATFDNIEVGWRYHPDHGLDVQIVETK